MIPFAAGREERKEEEKEGKKASDVAQWVEYFLRVLEALGWVRSTQKTSHGGPRLQSQRGGAEAGVVKFKGIPGYKLS